MRFYQLISVMAICGTGHGSVAPEDTTVVSRLNTKCKTDYDLSSKNATLAEQLEVMIAPRSGDQLSRSEMIELCAINHVVGEADSYREVKNEVEGRLSGLKRAIDYRRKFKKNAPFTSRTCSNIPVRQLTDNEIQMFENVFIDEENGKYKELEPHERKEFCRLLGNFGISNGETNNRDATLSELVKLRKRVHSFVSLDGLKSWFNDKINPDDHEHR